MTKILTTKKTEGIHKGHEEKNFMFLHETIVNFVKRLCELSGKISSKKFQDYCWWALLLAIASTAITAETFE